jgi:hypothetical protein
MFDSVDELVAEYDRRHLEGDLQVEDMDQPTPKYVLSLPVDFAHIT